VIVAPDFVQRIETIPLAMVTVLPPSTKVTLEPVPVPPPGILAKPAAAAASQTETQMRLREGNFMTFTEKRSKPNQSRWFLPTYRPRRPVSIASSGEGSIAHQPFPGTTKDLICGLPASAAITVPRVIL
jgi:hypothetical protein